MAFTGALSAPRTQALAARDPAPPRTASCYAEIYFAGGTVAKDISSRDLAQDLPAHLGRLRLCQDHQAVLGWVAERALPGDTVLVMGARDPDLRDWLGHWPICCRG